MPVLRAYPKSEEAYVDAAFLGVMGIDATVVDERGYGGNMLATTTAAVRIEVPEDQLDEARKILRSQEKPEPPAIAPPAAAPAGTSRLQHFLRAILGIDIVWRLLLLSASDYLSVTLPPEALASLSELPTSKALDTFLDIGHFPVLLLSLVSSMLCFFYSRLGRTLYVLITIWTLLSVLGTPEYMWTQTGAFLSQLQATLSPIALALMFWSPLADRFATARDASGAR